MFQIYDEVMNVWRSSQLGELSVILDQEEQLKQIIAEQGVDGLSNWLTNLEQSIKESDGELSTSRGIVRIRSI